MTRRFQDPELEVVHLLLQQMILKTRVERLQQRLATATELLTVADQGCDAEEQGDECPICEFLGYGTQSTTCSTNTNPEGTS